MPVKKKSATKKSPKRIIHIGKNTKTDPKFDFYKKVLLKTKDQIAGDIRTLSDENAGSGNDKSGDVSGHALHMADVATDMYDREFTLGLASNDRELLYDIDEALNRIQDGSFGVCAECKKSIPITRLKAIPHARLCLKCQEKLEAKRK